MNGATPLEAGDLHSFAVLPPREKHLWRASESDWCETAGYRVGGTVVGEEKSCTGKR